MVVIKINEICPEEIRPLMLEHIKYMEEIASQKLVDPEFASLFKAETGLTMDEFKNKYKNQLGLSSTSISGNSSSMWPLPAGSLENDDAHTKSEGLKFKSKQ